MRNYINIGSVPFDEECVQVGSQDYVRLSKIECNLFIKAIRLKLGLEVGTAKLGIKRFPHDFGAYYEVVCYYFGIEGEEYAFKCESEAPSSWAEVNMIEEFNTHMTKRSDNE